MEIVGPVLIDGLAVAPDDAVVSVMDIGFLRGYGVFEAMRSYGGTVFRLGRHLDRLGASAAMAGIPLPEREDLVAWCAERGAEGDVVVRLVVTAGSDPEQLGVDGKVIVFAEPFAGYPESVALTVRSAPWHPDGAFSELVGAKTLSYGPNTAVTRAARLDGFYGPVLIGRSGRVLEGPHFTVAWVTDGVVETPSLDLGILRSITREAMIETAAALGVKSVEGHFPLERLLGANEVFMMSTTTDITPVDLIDDATYPLGDVTERLAGGFADLVVAETR